jgi:hypothetical protein
MREIPTRSLPTPSVVPIRDTPHAPIVYFDGAHASGCANGIVTIALGASCPQIGPNGDVRGEVVIAAYLKCSIQAAIHLRAAIDNALRPTRQPPEVTAQGPAVRKN